MLHLNNTITIKSKQLACNCNNLNTKSTFKKSLNTKIMVKESDPLLIREEDEEKEQRRRYMDPKIWHKVAAISGVAAVGLGAYGVHVFKPENPIYKDVWQTASLYHLVHTAAVLAAPMTKHPNIFGGLMIAGIFAFSGTCYAVALLEDRKYSFLAPFGGFAYVAAWASLLF